MLKIPAKSDQSLLGKIAIDEGDDDLLIMYADDAIKATLKRELSDMNREVESSIDRLMRDNKEAKKKFAYDFAVTCQSLTKQIGESFANKKDLSAQVTGSYTSSFTQPTLTYWSECNKAKKAAVNLIFSELKRLNYNPKIVGLNDFSKDKDAGYSGGNVVLITCQFF